MKLLELNYDKIVALCKRYKVKNLWAFGSVLTSEFNDSSDVDLVVDFDETRIDLLDYADNFFEFLHSIERLIGRKVDLIVNKSIRNRFFRKEVNQTRILLWTAS